MVKTLEPLTNEISEKLLEKKDILRESDVINYLTSCECDSPCYDSPDPCFVIPCDADTPNIK